MKPLLNFHFNRNFAFAAALFVLAAGVAIAFFNQDNLGRQKLRELDIAAATLAQTVAAPVMFSDNSAAHEGAAAMGENPEVEAVAIYGQGGTLLATFVRPGAEAPPQHPLPHPAAFHHDTLDVVRSVAKDGQTYGAVYVRLRGEPLINQLARYAPIALLMVMTALVLAVAGAAQGALSTAYTELEQRARALAEEIEHRKKTEEALVQSRKMEAIGQLTGGVAHDFNNLLMVVSGGLRMLERRDDPERRKTVVSAMHQAVERGAGLTRQLLAFARRQKIELATVALDERLNAMRPLLERSLRADILLEIDMPANLPPVSTDPVQFELAILNLCVNARDAMPKGGCITISARPSQDAAMVELAVRDTGGGIPPEIIDRLFEPYFTTKPMGQGTGLGLSQVYGFAQQSGGNVRIESELGAGAVVWLSLPVSHETITREPLSPVEAANPDQGRRILVVEDDEGVAQTVTAMLEELGNESRRAGSAAEALEILSRDTAFDLIFSDIVMPGEMSGADLARQVDKHYPSIPVLLTTGYGGREDADPGRPLLRKPYTVEELRAALKPLLPARSAGESNKAPLRQTNAR